MKKIAYEMHPGFCVYNPETLMKLRNAGRLRSDRRKLRSRLTCSGRASIPSTPSRYLGDAIYFFHAKDTKHRRDQHQDPTACSTPSTTVMKSIAPGSSAPSATATTTQVWKDMMSALRIVGYDDAISIEHEDSLMTPNEGLQQGHRVPAGRA